jgi:CspA family cold shock protein
MSSNALSDTTSPEKFTGRVKWFNNKAGYGFVTITDGSKSGSDVFIHHSVIKVDSEQYKYLVQGEYVEFTLSSVEGGKHEFQAVDVCGIKGGKLMCETRHELKSTRTSYKQDKTGGDDEDPSSPRPRHIERLQSIERQHTSAPRVPRAVKPPVDGEVKRPYKSRNSAPKSAQEKPAGEWTTIVRKNGKK